MTRETEFTEEIGAQETRKLRLRAQGVQNAWFGFGMFGLIGWSVSVPTLAGAFVGQELDKLYPGPHSWTLTLIILGLVLGILNAWAWMSKQGKTID